MGEIWRLQAKLCSEALLSDENDEITLGDQRGNTVEIRFSRPRKVEGAKRIYWDKSRPNYDMWSYDVTIRFEANDEDDANDKAWGRLEDIATRLSFLVSAPVIVESYGTITNAPEPPEVGKQYVTIFSQGTLLELDEQRPVLENLKAFEEFLLNDTLGGGRERKGRENRNERIHRGMRWLQHSHLSQTPVDEFLYLMLSFEGISSLLAPAAPHYWHCSSCDKDVLTCPHCGASTEWEGSGNLAMKRFVCEGLGWEASQWTRIWKLRNIVVHGSHDLTREQQQTIIGYLPRLEEAVVSALKYLARSSPDALPLTLRKRGTFSGARLRITWIL